MEMGMQFAAAGPRRALVRASAGDFVGEFKERDGRSVLLLRAVEVRQRYHGGSRGDLSLGDLLIGNVRVEDVGPVIIQSLTIHEASLVADLPERGVIAWESLFQQVHAKKES